MSELRELYQEMILDHNRNPRNFGELAGASRKADGYNPLCGDKVRVAVQVEKGVVKGIAFKGSGCAISTASASLMTESLKGKRVAEAKRLFATFHGMLTGKEADAGALGKLAVFAGVCEFPARVKCATLAWHTMKAALEGKQEQVTTE